MSYKLIINNFEADLFDDFKISFEKENQIWQFDSIKLSRSHNIILPPTPKNNAFFGFSNKPEFEGLEVRSNYSAEIWYSGGKIEGTLFVSDFSAKAYNCIFVFGELLLLKKIKDAGKLKQLLNLDTDIVWDDTTPIRSFSTDFNLLGLYEYVVGGGVDERDRGLLWNYMPITGFVPLLNECKSVLDFNINFGGLTGFASELGIKLNGMNGSFAKIAPDSDLNFNTGANDPTGWNSDFFDIKLKPIPNYYQIGIGQYDKWRMFEAKSEFTVVVYLNQYLYKRATSYSHYVDAGIMHIRRGQLLEIMNNVGVSKTTFRLKKNDCLFFYTRIWESTIDKVYTFRYHGKQELMFPDDFNPISCKMMFYGESNKLTYPTLSYPLQANLPDVTVIDLLKTFENLTGTAMYLEGNTIKFFNYNFNSYDPIELQNVISENSIKRSILNFAQNNYINFESSENVEENAKVIRNLPILNANLEKELTVFTIPFSEGNKRFLNPSETAYEVKISDITLKIKDDEKTYEFGQDKDTLVSKHSGAINQVEFTTGDDKMKIFENSTSIEISVKMSLYELMKINEFSTFLYRNKKWSWANAMWSDNVAKLELIKLPDNIKLVGYVAFSSSNLITIKSGNFSNAKTKLKFSYNNKEIFPTYNDELDDVLVPKNLLLKSGEEVTNNLYLLNTYTPSEWLIQDEVYTALYDVKLKDNATYISPYMSRGSAGQRFQIYNPIVGVRSVQIATGIARYADGMTPQDDPINGILRLYILPNEQLTGGADNTIYKIKVEKGSNPNPVWTPAPEDSVSIFDKSANVTASIVGDELVVTAMSGNDGWVDMKFEYLNFEEIKRIEIIKN